MGVGEIASVQNAERFIVQYINVLWKALARNIRYVHIAQSISSKAE